MLTTTHAAINGIVAHRSAKRGRTKRALHWHAFFIGGVAPDVMLFALMLGAVVYFPLTSDLSVTEAHRYAMDVLFFDDPIWIAAHNSLHAPIVLAMIVVGGAGLPLRARHVLWSFASGALLHSLIDILVHHDDGPLLLFPFSWTLRFESPISYWDPAHYGWFIRPIDLAITAGGAWWALRRTIARRTGRNESDHETDEVSSSAGGLSRGL